MKREKLRSGVVRACNVVICMSCAACTVSSVQPWVRIFYACHSMPAYRRLWARASDKVVVAAPLLVVFLCIALCRVFLLPTLTSLTYLQTVLTQKGARGAGCPSPMGFRLRSNPQNPIRIIPARGSAWAHWVQVARSQWASAFQVQLTLLRRRGRRC
jgi:hypothetical protein